MPQSTVTIATHNGSQIARQHNLRNRKITDKETHIDQNGTHETWLDVAPRTAYKNIFNDAVERYNARQTRSDRKIYDYYKSIQENPRKHTAYEMICGVYGGDVPQELSRQILHEYVDGWKHRNPNLALIGVYYHADEVGGDHIHVDYVPVARGYTRGMDTQTAIDRALQQQGFQTKGRSTAQIQWERSENETLETICRKHGLQVEHPQRDGVRQQHLEKQLYIKQQQVKELTERCEKLQERVMSLEQIRDVEHKPSRWDKTKDLVDRDDLERLTRTAAQVDQMRERVNEIEAAEKDATRIREAANQYADDIRRGADFDMQKQIAQRKAEYDKLMQQCQQIQLRCNNLQKIIDACPDAQEMQLKQLRERERIDPWQPNRRRRFTRDIEIER